jgi:hypothetical protein
MKPALRPLIILIIAASLISCGSTGDTIKSYDIIGPKNNSESFFAVQLAKSHSTIKRTLLEIDSMNRMKFYSNALNDYSGGNISPLNDSLVLIETGGDSIPFSIIIYNINTLKKLLILKSYRLVSASNNGHYFLTCNHDSDYYSLQLFSVYDNGCKFIASIPNVQVHDILPFRQSDFIVRPKNRFRDTNQALFMIVDSLGQTKDSIASTHTGKLIWLSTLGFEGENPNQIITPIMMPFERGDSMSHTYLYVYDHSSKHLRPIITDMEITLFGFPVKNTSLLIFKGATIKEYWEEEREIMKALQKHRKENPDLIIDGPSRPEGKWRMRDLKNGNTRILESRMKYFVSSPSGRYIAISFDDKHIRIVQSKTLWDDAK